MGDFCEINSIDDVYSTSEVVVSRVINSPIHHFFQQSAHRMRAFIVAQSALQLESEVFHGRRASPGRPCAFAEVIHVRGRVFPAGRMLRDVLYFRVDHIQTAESNDVNDDGEQRTPSRAMSSVSQAQKNSFTPVR